MLLLIFILYILISVNCFVTVKGSNNKKFSIRKHIFKIGNNDDKVESPASINPLVAVDSMNSIDQTWDQLEYFGDVLVNYSKTSLFFRSFAAGIFVGFGGILTASVGFDMGVLPWEAGNGFARFLSGAVGFPLTIFLVSMTGCGAWTGDMLLVSRAYFSPTKDTNAQSAIRMAIITWLGCLAGTFVMAAVATGALLPACRGASLIAAHKLEYTFFQTFLRGILGGCLICLAIFMSKLNRDMIGKTIGIWFPISTYVICDFEHVLASMFFLSCAKMNGAKFTWLDFLKFLVPSTLGNLVGGALLIGGAFFAIPKKFKTSVEKKKVLARS